YSRLVSSVYGLMNLGFFSKVEPDIQQGSAPGLLKITYIIEEQSTAEIRFGLQVTTNKWPPDVTLFGEISEKNFLGRELVMSGKIDLSMYKQGFTFTLDDPWFFNYPWSLGASVKFYHEWTQQILRNLNNNDYDKYRDDKSISDKLANPSDNDIRNYYLSKYSGKDEENPNYLGASGVGSWIEMGLHSINFEIGARIGYRFARYFSVIGEYTLTPIYSFIPTTSKNYFDKSPTKSDDIANPSWKSMVEENGGWPVKSKIAATFGINTTLQRINPYEGIKFSLTSSYTWGHFDSVGLSSKFTVYWKILDINFNDWPLKQVLVFNTAASFIFPGFRNIGGELNGVSTAGRGPILYPSDYLTVDGFFLGRGWGNSIAATTSEGRLTSKTGFARFDFSLEYRIPIHEKYVWLAGFVDMVNLIEGPTFKRPLVEDGQIKSVNGSIQTTTDYSNSWMWWNQTRDNSWYSTNAYNKEDMKNWYSVDNWYGSLGVGVQLALPQLPLSFYIVKRFKINQYSGFEWIHNSPGTANLDFV
ncbi:MAG TPA: BamA/TamA family outer membrane protein, partial [Spirochaetota bacterium]|nr:BamA/TamA family outer membrane protein [Spirochaetota bacterium]